MDRFAHVVGSGGPPRMGIGHSSTPLVSWWSALSAPGPNRGNRVRNGAAVAYRAVSLQAASRRRPAPPMLIFLAMPEFPAALLDVLRCAGRVAVLTGAGVSAESGVPTFRDAQTGLWARYSPEELATPEAFRANPQLVWDWYAWRRKLVAQAVPNPGHRALAALQRQCRAFRLITQNVDGLHQRAGSRDVVELHGNIARVKCFDGCGVVEAYDETGRPPRCPACGAWLRPDVVWFGEMLPPEALATAERAAAECDAFLSVGTSAVVYPAADLPWRAKRAGAVLVEINRDETPLSGQVDHLLRGPAGEILPALLAAIGQ